MSLLVVFSTIVSCGAPLEASKDNTTDIKTSVQDQDLLAKATSAQRFDKNNTKEVVKYRVQREAAEKKGILLSVDPSVPPPRKPLTPKEQKELDNFYAEVALNNAGSNLSFFEEYLGSEQAAQETELNREYLDLLRDEPWLQKFGMIGDLQLLRIHRQLLE